MKKRLKILLLSFFILILFITSGCNLPELLGDNYAADYNGLTVSFIDVGQGDATLIECGNEAMLIDAGLYSEKESLVSYITRRGIRNLKYCVATHPHSDHIGAMDEVIYRYDVDTLVYPLCDDGSENMNYLFDACDERGVSYLNPNPMDTLTLGDATFTVLSPEPYAEYGNLNNNSIVLKMEYGNTNWLFMGDAEKEVEKELLNQDINLSADVLKCGHHGSSTSSDVSFINAVSPEVAVISCGKNNDYGHPHRETLSTLNKREIEIYRTDQLSSIIANSDGETITFMSANETLSTITAKSKTDCGFTGNLNRKVFHSKNCEAVTEMKENNKINFKTREDAVSKGYTPCKSCNP